MRVKEPPRDGEPSDARFHLMDAHELIGWTDSYEDAQDWVKGFGPHSSTHIEDRRSWVRAS